MSPAWFSIAILTPASMIRDRLALSTFTVSAMWFSMPERRSACVPSTQRTIGDLTITAAATRRAICSSAVPSALLKSPEVGQIERIPISRPIFSSSARARILRRLSGASATCQSGLPRNRVSLKCTTLTCILAAQSSIWKGVQFCAPRLYMSTPNRTFAAALDVINSAGIGTPIVIATAPMVLRNSRRSAMGQCYSGLVLKRASRVRPCATTMPGRASTSAALVWKLTMQARSA